MILGAIIIGIGALFVSAVLTAAIFLFAVLAVIYKAFTGK